MAKGKAAAVSAHIGPLGAATAQARAHHPKPRFISAVLCISWDGDEGNRQQGDDKRSLNHSVQWSSARNCSGLVFGTADEHGGGTGFSCLAGFAGSFKYW